MLSTPVFFVSVAEPAPWACTTTVLLLRKPAARDCTRDAAWNLTLLLCFVEAARPRTDDLCCNMLTLMRCCGKEGAFAERNVFEGLLAECVRLALARLDWHMPINHLQPRNLSCMQAAATHMPGIDCKTLQLNQSVVGPFLHNTPQECCAGSSRVNRSKRVELSCWSL